MRPIVLIPARMAASRLPGKPLADIGGAPMIVRVLRQAEAAGVGPVAVAAGETEICAAVERAGGRAVLTDPDLPSGSDRILAALAVLDPDRRHDVVVNLQGDMPFIDPALVGACAGLLDDEPTCDIATVDRARGVAGRAHRSRLRRRRSWRCSRAASARGRLYFTRSTLYGDGPVWRHIGVYAYRRQALDRFAAAPPSALERREKLEQLRALELGLSIWAVVADAMPIEVNTPAELAVARRRAEQAA